MISILACFFENSRIQSNHNKALFQYIQAQVSLQEANQAVGSVESLHTALVLQNYYMPELTSSVITCQYLFNVALGKCFRLKTNEIQIGQLFKKVSKLNVFEELERIAQEKQINLGFTNERLPDIKWLLNVLHTLNENNVIFKQYLNQDNVIGLTKDDMNILRGLDTSFGRKKSFKFFKRTQQQIAERKVFQTKHKLQIVKNKLSRKKQESEKIEQKMRNYQIKVSQMSQKTQKSVSNAPIFKKQMKQ